MLQKFCPCKKNDKYQVCDHKDVEEDNVEYVRGGGGFPHVVLMSGGSSRMYFGRPWRDTILWSQLLQTFRVLFIATWPHMNWESSSLKLFELRLTKSQEPALRIGSKNIFAICTFCFEVITNHLIEKKN